MTITADIEVVCPGMLEVLSVGKGDIKLTVGGTSRGCAATRRVTGARRISMTVHHRKRGSDK